ncbi:MAG: CinA family nicotinamide mononucleotide deamidase-related protein [Anaerolineae bacterium]|nr:CinA family nicotinamide mononucleotide deamidase-related protein [Anaerolineae bacterium]
MNAEIISIGTELLLGEIVDTNSAHIARSLRDIGLDLYFTTTVGDNQARITHAIDIALDRADIVITTGGLGPTVDDVTRQAVAAATNRPLVFQQALFDQIAARFARMGSPMSENNRQQAFIPEGALPIENPVGTAPCFALETERGVVISLPGVPHEMKYLLEQAVIPYLRERFHLTSIIKARVLRTAGIGESAVDAAILDLMTLANPTVGLAAHTGQTDIRITAKAESEAVADAMIAAIEAQIRARLGEYIYGLEKETIEAALIQELSRLGMKLAVSETGLGNRLSSRIQAVGGAEYILSGVQQFETPEALYATLANAQELSLEQLSIAAASRARESFHADIAIAVIMRPDAALIGVATPRETRTRIFRFSEQDGHPFTWASTWGMALAWHWLHQQPAP